MENRNRAIAASVCHTATCRLLLLLLLDCSVTVWTSDCSSDNVSASSGFWIDSGTSMAASRIEDIASKTEHLTFKPIKSDSVKRYVRNKMKQLKSENLLALGQRSQRAR